MTLVLDARQRAMLAEMGLRIWQHDGAEGGLPVRPAGAGSAPALVTPGLAPRSGVAAAVLASPAAPPAPRALARAAPAAPATALPQVRTGSEEDRAAAWQILREGVIGCAACGLCEGRRNPVPGSGDLNADILVVGEGPGEGEDLLGTPFAGQEGLLLDNMLRALGRDRRRGVFLTHALKCRAPANRSPEPGEVAQCEAHLRSEVELLRPRVILALGRLAVQALLPASEPLGKLRGRVHDYRGVPVVVSYAPSYLLRNLPEKARAWADLCLAQDVVAGQPPAPPD